MIHNIKRTIDWAARTGILARSNPQAQLLKLVEEFGEFSSAHETRDLLDELGDVIVVCTVIQTLLVKRHPTYSTVGLSIHHIDGIGYRTGTRGNGLDPLRFMGALARLLSKGQDDEAIVYLQDNTFDLVYAMVPVGVGAMRNSFDYENTGSAMDVLLGQALNKIERRTGRMVNGVFVKDAA